MKYLIICIMMGMGMGQNVTDTVFHPDRYNITIKIDTLPAPIPRTATITADQQINIRFIAADTEYVLKKKLKLNKYGYINGKERS